MSTKVYEAEGSRHIKFKGESLPRLIETWIKIKHPKQPDVTLRERHRTMYLGHAADGLPRHERDNNIDL